MSTSLLLISRQSPWRGLVGKECLDIALAGGAFELPVSMLWLDDGVWQLLCGQQPSLLQQKDLQAQLAALPVFGVENLYVAQHSLQERGLTAADLSIEVIAIDIEQISELIARHQQVISL